MPEYRQIGQEVWICESVQCLAPPSVYLVLQGKDAHFYPVRLVGVGESSLVELDLPIDDASSLERFEDLWSFCRGVSHFLLTFY